MNSFLSSPQVAIVMRSKNEQPYAEKTLEALIHQTYQDYLLYNVDSGSTDGTLEAIRKYNLHPSCIVQIVPESYIPGRVLNEMIARAKEPIIVLLNSDAIPQDRYWLETLIDPLLKGKADATMSRQVARPDAYFIVSYDYLRTYSHWHMAKNPHFFSAVSCAFKRELWEGTKFYTQGISEDFLWSKICQEKGAHFQFVPDSIVEHSHNYTLKQLYRRRYGEALAENYIYGTKASFSGELFALGKELLRDLLYALIKGRFLSIPYNIVYRFTCYWGYFWGKRAGNKRF